MIEPGASSPDAVTIRPARSGDAAAFAGLSTQLGYPVSAGALGGRLERLLLRDDQVILAACAGLDAVVGWIHGAEQELLESERRCEILGLVAAVEGWALARGLTHMSVRSNVARAESHPFYEGIGYRRTKTQQVYRKRLGAPA
jgi:hypothetical protein